MIAPITATSTISPKASARQRQDRNHPGPRWAPVPDPAWGWAASTAPTAQWWRTSSSTAMAKKSSVT